MKKQIEKLGTLPVVELKEPEANVISDVNPLDSDYNKGIWIHEETQEPYALAITEPNNYGRTHHLKNTAHSWSGTLEQFKLAFVKA